MRYVVRTLNLTAIERLTIVRALRLTQIKTDAAKALGVSRHKLHRAIIRHKIKREEKKKPARGR